MVGRVDARAALGERHLADHLGDQLALGDLGELAAQDVAILRRRGPPSVAPFTIGTSPSRSSASTERIALGAHLRLVLVEQRVVGVAEVLEALVTVGVAAGEELDVLLADGAAGSRSQDAFLASTQALLADRLCAGHLARATPRGRIAPSPSRG